MSPLRKTCCMEVYSNGWVQGICFFHLQSDTLKWLWNLPPCCNPFNCNPISVQLSCIISESVWAAPSKQWCLNCYCLQVLKMNVRTLLAASTNRNSISKAQYILIKCTLRRCTHFQFQGSKVWTLVCKTGHTLQDIPCSALQAEWEKSIYSPIHTKPCWRRNFPYQFFVFSQPRPSG